MCPGGAPSAEIQQQESPGRRYGAHPSVLLAGPSQGQSLGSFASGQRHSHNNSNIRSDYQEYIPDTESADLHLLVLGPARRSMMLCEVSAGIPFESAYAFGHPCRSIQAHQLPASSGALSELKWP